MVIGSFIVIIVVITTVLINRLKTIPYTSDIVYITNLLCNRICANVISENNLFRSEINQETIFCIYLLEWYYDVIRVSLVINLIIQIIAMSL